MSDADSGAVPASNPRAAPVDYLAQYEARERLKTELYLANKAALLDALAGGGIVSVVVTFDGCGDSGQIESIDARDAHGEISLSELEVDLLKPDADGSGIETANVPMAEAVERIAYDLLESLYAGWENNDGAYGEFTFDVPGRAITLDYNGRYVAVEAYSHQF